MEHAQLEGAVAAYALGALDEAERPEAEKALLDHLPGCASCREMLNDFREVVGDLALVAPPSVVPEAVEERILEGIREQRQTIAPRSPVRRSPWARVAVAAVAAAVVALGAWNVQLASRVRNADTRTDKLASALSLVGAPDAHSASLSGQSGSMVLVWRPGEAVLVGHDVVAPPSGKVLQLWLMRAGVPTSVGAFRPSGGIVVLPVSVDPMGFDRAAITVEKAPSARQPTSPPIFSASLSA
jgi:anti-sigma-K factor RskA